MTRNKDYMCVLFCVCNHIIFVILDPKDAITFLEKTKEKVG